MSVKDGRLVLPDGMSYRLLVLPAVETMTPELLRKIKELVAAGATVVGPPPVKSPSLSDYPECDQEVQRLAAELWGRAAAGRIDRPSLRQRPRCLGRGLAGPARVEIRPGQSGSGIRKATRPNPLRRANGSCAAPFRWRRGTR